MQGLQHLCCCGQMPNLSEGNMQAAIKVQGSRDALHQALFVLLKHHAGPLVRQDVQAAHPDANALHCAMKTASSSSDTMQGPVFRMLIRIKLHIAMLHVASPAWPGHIRPISCQMRSVLNAALVKPCHLASCQRSCHSPGPTQAMRSKYHLQILEDDLNSNGLYASCSAKHARVQARSVCAL